MLDIMFSIPIHQRLEVVVDQILNFRNFNPNCGIVFHLSQGFDYEGSQLKKDQFISITHKIGNIFINPVSVRTGFGDIIQAHLSNYKYIKSIAEFNYFAISASNESFIKSGLYDTIKCYDCGVQQLDVTEWDTNSHFAQDAKTDHYTKALLEGLNYNRIIFSYIEGQYYSKVLFDTIHNYINNYYNYQSATKFYPREEYYFSTVLASLKNNNPSIKVGPIFAFSAYHLGHLFDARPSEISRLIKTQPHIFTIKRVDRMINDNVRCYLRQKYGYLQLERELMQSYVTIKEMKRLHIAFMDVCKFVNTIIEKRKVILRKLGLLKKATK